MKKLELYIKTVPVNVLAFITDVICMYFFGDYLQLPLLYQTFISSFLSQIVSFIGYIKYTFKERYKNKKKKNMNYLILKYLLWNFSMLYIVNISTIKFHDFILNYIINYDFSSENKIKMNKFLIQDKNGNLEFKTYINIFIKHFVQNIFYVLLTIPIYNKIF